MKPTPALPIVRVSLRVLIVGNWVFGAGILALLLYTFANEAWTARALGVSGFADSRAVMAGMRAIAALGVVAIPFNDAVLRRLLAMVESVRSGDLFAADNADRLRAIAWALLALQLLSLVIGAIAKSISTPAHPFHLDAGFSIAGWLAVLLTFVLASVFAEGTRLRDDLEGTV